MSAQSSNLETLLRAAFAAGISYADGINENGIETVWQMRKDELVPAVETTTPPREIICYSPCNQHKGMTFTMHVGYAPPVVNVCPICYPPEPPQQVKTTPDTPKC